MFNLKQKTEEGGSNPIFSKKAPMESLSESHRHFIKNI